MGWRRLRVGELDHEALWLGVSVVAAGLAWAWTAAGLATPQCAFHAVTGVPCPACGATRAFVHITHGAWPAALALNPLACAAFAAVVAFDCYAATVLLVRSRRWRWEAKGRGLVWLRVAVIALVALNWAWVIRAGV
jgi:hypothetical protein